MDRRPGRGSEARRQRRCGAELQKVPKRGAERRHLSSGFIPLGVGAGGVTWERIRLGMGWGREVKNSDLGKWIGGGG